MATADGYVLPKPGIPKTLGILNVIFGVLLVLGGACQLGLLAVAPAGMNYIEAKVKEAQSKIEAQEKAEIKAFDDKLAEAKTDEEKKAVEKEKADAIVNQPKLVPVDMTTATAALRDPTIKAVNIGSLGSGLVIHCLLLASGIGLIRLTPWGRSLALAWSGLIILQIIAVMVATIFWVVPINNGYVEKQVAAIEAKAKEAGTPVDPAIIQMTKLGAQLAVPMAVGGSLTGMIYPVVLLILLSTKGARAACLPKKLESLDDL